MVNVKKRYLIGTFLVLGVLVLVHELGHFLTAKKSGIRVDEFAIGFPPRIFSWVRGGTRYALNLIPFGGYVKIFGENPDDESMAKDAKDSFVNKPKSTQAAVLIAGVMFNVIFAWLMFSLAFMNGFDIPKDTLGFVDNSTSKIQIIEIEKETPAERSGLESGNEIFGLKKGQEVSSFNNAEEALQSIRENEAPFTLQTSKGEINIESKLERG
jgi:regulator of sigma E protease